MDRTCGEALEMRQKCCLDKPCNYSNRIIHAGQRIQEGHTTRPQPRGRKTVGLPAGVEKSRKIGEEDHEIQMRT